MGTFKSMMLSILLFVNVLLFFSACSSTLYNDSRVNITKIKSYKLRPGDIIEIKFDYYPDFNQTVLINSDGTISLRGLGELNVIDLSPDLLEDLLHEKYSNLLAEPAINIEIQEATKFKVYFGGDLKHPGIVNFRGDLSIAQGIILAGGLKSNKVNYEITIFRSGLGNKMKTYNFNLKKSGQKNKSISHFKLAPYDVVIVLKTQGKNKKNGFQI